MTGKTKKHKVSSTRRTGDLLFWKQEKQLKIISHKEGKTEKKKTSLLWFSFSYQITPVAAHISNSDWKLAWTAAINSRVLHTFTAKLAYECSRVKFLYM